MPKKFEQALVKTLLITSNTILALTLFYFLTGEALFFSKNPFPTLTSSLFVVLALTYIIGSSKAIQKTWTFRLFNWILEKSSKLMSTKPLLFVTILFVIYSIFYVLIAVLRYLNYHAFICDYGIVYQALWNTLHGNFLISSVKGNIHRFSDHFEPIILAYLPFIKLFPSPTVLVAIQNIALFSALYPLYMLSKRWLKSPYLTSAVLFAYIMFMPLKSVALSDYHSIALFVPIFLFALYFLDSKKYVLYFIFIIFSLSIKETIGIKLFIFGFALAVFKKKHRLIGALTALIGLIHLYVSFFVVMPSLKNPYLHFSLYKHLGNSPLEIALSPFTKPKVFWGELFSADAIKYLFLTLAPLLFLPLLEPVTLVALVVMYAQLIFPQGSMGIHLSHHHAAEFLSFSFYGFILILSKIEGRWHTNPQRIKALALCILLTGFIFYEKPEMHLIRKFAQPASPDIKTIEEVIKAKIPLNASVSANQCIALHLANRRYVYPLLGLQYNPEYVVVHEKLCPWPFKRNELEAVHEKIESKGYELIFRQGDLSLYKNER